MSLLALIGVALGGAAIAGIAGGSTRRGQQLGLVAIAATAVSTLVLVPGETVSVGSASLVVTEYARLLLATIAWWGLGLTVLSAAARVPTAIGAVLSGVIAVCALALCAVSPLGGAAAAMAAGLLTIVLAPRGDVEVLGRQTARGLQTIGVGGVVVLAGLALVPGPAEAFQVPGILVGLAVLGVAGAIAAWFGVIPFHRRAASLAVDLHATEAPVALVVAPVVLVTLVLTWIDSTIGAGEPRLGSEQLAIGLLALASTALAVGAAAVQRGLERIGAYGIIQDAGFVLFGIAALDPGAWVPLRSWLVVMVAVRLAFAAWAAAMSRTFGTTTVARLAGWARGAPLLGVTLALLTVSAVGWPGLLGFDVRIDLARLGLGDILEVAGIACLLASVVGYVRLFVVGLRPPGADVASAERHRPRWSGTQDAHRVATTAAAPAVEPGGAPGPVGPSTRGPSPRGRWFIHDLVATMRLNGPLVAASVALLLAIGATLTAAGALGVAEAARGRPPQVATPRPSPQETPPGPVPGESALPGSPSPGTDSTPGNAGPPASSPAIP